MQMKLFLLSCLAVVCYAQNTKHSKSQLFFIKRLPVALNQPGGSTVILSSVLVHFTIEAAAASGKKESLRAEKRSKGECRHNETAFYFRFHDPDSRGRTRVALPSSPKRFRSQKSPKRLEVEEGLARFALLYLCREGTTNRSKNLKRRDPLNC